VSALNQTALDAKLNSSSFTKSGIGLGNVDNTSDANKPISSATQTALNNKEASFIAVQPLVKAFTTQTINGVTSAVNTIELNPSVSGIDRILMSNNQGAPTHGTRSAGVKIVLYDSLTAGQPDVCIGLEPSFMYFAMPSAVTGYKFYGNTTPCTTIMGDGNITTIGSIAAASAQITNNCSVGGNLTVTGTITRGGVSVQTIPYLAFRYSGAVLSSNNGQIASGSITVGTRTTGQDYVFTFSPAHPRGTNCTVMATPETLAAFCVTSTIVNSSTSFTVRCRNAANTGIDSNFSVMTVP
jgi:hypothetical protein